MAVKIIKIEDIKFKELSAAIKAINDSGKLPDKIVAVGKSKEDLVNLFIGAVQAIPDAEDGTWTGPDAAAEYYQKITVPDEAPAAPAAGTKKGGAAKTKTPSAPKEPKEKKKGRLFISASILAKAKGETVTDLIKAADAEYAKEGGKANEKEAAWAMKTVLAAVEAFDLFAIADGKITRK